MRGIFNGSRGLFAGFVARDMSTSCLMQEDADGEVFELFFKNPRFIQLSVFESGNLGKVGEQRGCWNWQVLEEQFWNEAGAISCGE
jgi:hypothetical protein